MSAQTIPFPRAKKRGAKVKRGPCAVLLQFPAPASDEEVARQFTWLALNAVRDWHEERLVGPVEERFCVVSDDPEIRAITRQRAMEMAEVVRRRVTVKDWLESLGADWGEVKDAEEALWFLLERFRTSSGIPPAA